MKLLQLLENTAPQFPLPQFPTSKEEVETVLKKYKIANYAINPDLTVDVNGDVNLNHEHLDFLPIKFNTIHGNFKCHVNKLKTLLGSPVIVFGDFRCEYNNLTSLQYGPKEVGGDYNCSNNQLTTLKHAPREINKNFICSYNKLTDPRGSPREVGGDYDCSNNQLVTLRGAPKVINGCLWCKQNKRLKSFDGIGKVHRFMSSDFALIRQT